MTYSQHRRSTATDLLRRRLLQGLATACLPGSIAMAGSTGRSGIVETGYGRLRGVVEGRIKVFKGIPYGADTASTRFRRPKPPEPWPGIRDAVDYGPRCPQLERRETAPRRLLHSWSVPQQQSEDCLYLNIWTPATGDNGKRPVMVWLHGGGFASGSGAATVYEGNRLAEQGDVVMVTVNHRLNVFGYLCLAEAADEFADSGNAGQHDIIAALRWIRENIAEFGGDPGNVTLFGESGGGAKICTLLAMNGARGLFHRAIIQSGPMLWAANMDRATRTGRLGLAALGADNGRLRRLDSASMDDVMKALTHITGEGRFRTLAPVLDGRGLTRHPFSPDAPDVSRDVPVMLGFNATEATFLLGFDDSLFALSWQALPDRLAPFAGEADVDRIVSQYRDAFPEYSPADVFFDVTTMQMIGLNTLRIADLRAAQPGASTWFYELHFETGVDGGKWKSPHTLDVPLIFNNVEQAGSTFADTGRAQPVASAMSSAWIEFARHGKPAVPADLPWPDWTNGRTTMIFDSTVQVASAPQKWRSEVLEDVPFFDITQPSNL